jgi:hypothetical protein
MGGNMGDKKIGYGDDLDDLDDLDEMLGKQRRERQFRKDMARWKAQWDAGDITAASRAAHECVVRRVADLGIDADWLIDAVRKLTVLAATKEEKRQRREWHIHQTRWEELAELRDRRHELLERSGNDRGTSWERAREAVSESLANDEAAGSPSSVKASYELVEAAGGKDATFESYKAVLQQRAAKKPG